MGSNQLTKERLGQLLLKKKLVSESQLLEALKQQEGTGRPLGEILIAFGYVEEKDVLEVLSAQMQVPYFDLTNFEPTDDALALIPVELAKEYIVIPAFKAGNILTLAMSDPLDLDAIARLRHSAGCDINPVLSSSRSILGALERFYKIGPAGVESAPDTDAGQAPVQQESARTVTPARQPSGRVSTSTGADKQGLRQAERIRLEDGGLNEAAREAPVIRKVNSIIDRAVKDGASDIHFEPTEKELQIRCRIDGVLHKLPSIAKSDQDAMISRVKIMANIDIAERRLPQDGRIQVHFDEKDVDLRVSTFPTIYGESIVMRLLVKSEKPPAMIDLGFSDDMLTDFEDLLKRPNGMILVTGPTGSGKTTTLYAALSIVNTTDRNIITLEDPVEYRLEGIRQSQIAPKAGLSFAQGLRAVVRQDPDVIMVGEIRDVETAQIAIHAALTGHLVFSTLHTNDAPGAVARLLDMGVEPFLVASSVVGVIAQRLIRLICEECRAPLKISPLLLANLKMPKKDNIVYYQGKGCKMCKMTGYRGRSVIAELMIPNAEIRRLIVEKGSSEQIRDVMVKAGMPTLMDDGVNRVAEGVTTLEEIIRQVG